MVFEILTIGENMVLLQIKNKQWLSKLVTYFDHNDIEYTTNPDSEYDMVLFMELTDSVFYKIKEKDKKVFFLSYLEEQKIFEATIKNNSRSRAYLKKISRFLRCCDTVIVSQIGMQKLIRKISDKKIDIIPYELPVINVSLTLKELYQKYSLSKKKKKILILDSEYRYLKWVNVIAYHYPKYQILYLGYAPDYSLSEQKRELLHHLKENVLLIKYFDFASFSDLVKISSIVISVDSLIKDHSYLDLILFFGKPLLIMETNFYSDYLIDSKNCYMFHTGKTLCDKLAGMITGQYPPVTEFGYQLIKGNNEKEILKKYSNYIR